MKKVLATLTAALLAGVMLSGCGDDANSPGDEPSGTQSTKDGGGGGY